MWTKVISFYPFAIKFVPKAIGLKACVPKSLILVLLYLIMFLIDVTLKQHVIKLIPEILLWDILPNKCVIKLLIFFYKH